VSDGVDRLRPVTAALGGCPCDGCSGDAEPRPDGFDPADTVYRVAAAMTGMVWHSLGRGEWTVTSAEPVSFTWPIRVRITVCGSPWPLPRAFEVQFGWADTFPCATPAGNAEGLAEDGMVLVEEYVQTGPVARLDDPDRVN
jgi:hypothetical protein